MELNLPLELWDTLYSVHENQQLYARMLCQGVGELGTIPFYVTETKTCILSASEQLSLPDIRCSAERCFQPKC